MRYPLPLHHVARYIEFSEYFNEKQYTHQVYTQLEIETGRKLRKITFSLQAHILVYSKAIITHS